MSGHEGQDTDDGDAADLAGTGQERSHSANEAAVEEAIGEKSRPNDGDEAHDEEIVRSPRSQELIRAADLLVSASETELKDAGLGTIVGASYYSHWSGMLPSPVDYNGYDEPTRERICRWNDAFTVDESARQDRLVDNEIKQQDRGVILSFGLVVGFGVAAFISFLVTRDVASFGFLSVPLLNYLSNLFTPIMSKSSRGSDKDASGKE